MESAPKNSSEDFNLEEELDKFSDDLLDLEEVSKILLSNYHIFIYLISRKKLLNSIKTFFREIEILISRMMLWITNAMTVN